MSIKHGFDLGSFYRALEREVRRKGVRWTDLSKDTGVGNTTLSRMAQGRVPDGASVAALSAWAGLNAANYVDGTFVRSRDPRTLEQIALLFKQDSLLTDEARVKLETIVEAAYDALKSDKKVRRD